MKTYHSAEPWRFEPGADNTSTDEDLKLGSVRSATNYHVARVWRDAEGATHNARRIVACVNACAGIPSEALEAGAVAEALDALVGLVARRERACREAGGDPNGSDGRYVRARLVLRALGRLP